MRCEQNLHFWLQCYGYERDRTMDLRYITALGGFSTYSHSFPQEKNTMCKYFAQYTYILRSHIYSKIYIYIQVPRIYLTCFSDGGHPNISNQNFQKNVTCNLKMRRKLWKMHWRTSLMLKLGRWKQNNQNLQGAVLVPVFFGVVVGFFWTYFYIWNTALAILVLYSQVTCSSLSGGIHLT